MHAPPAPPVIQPPPKKRRWLWLVVALLLIPLMALGGLALGVASYFRLSSDTRALRNELTQASGAKWRKQLNLNIGNTTLSLARVTSALVKLDADVHTALNAVRGVEVAIYELDSTAKVPDRAAMLNATDKALNSRGWERVVGVLDGDDMVSVFLPAKISSANQLKFCVVVLDGRQLVLVSARVNPQPLLELVQNKSDWRTAVHSLAKR